MLKKFAITSLVVAALCSPLSALASINLSQYDKISTASGLMENKDVTKSLKALLGSDYETYINNFEVYGEPHKTRDGALFVEGWMQDLYKENASALIVFPDGKISAAWVVPESDVIQYKSNADGAEINKDIKAWAERFGNMQFASLRSVPADYSETAHFNTDSFSIELTTVCDAEKNCNVSTYHGTRKKDGAELTLKGVAVRKGCDSGICPIISYEFRKGNAVYSVSKLDNTLTVVNNNKTVVNQTGIWSK
ncbi:hypothetical protein KXR87_23005 [Yokenella regensburgei]|uniref:hypothetical protein n=1 Tax=Yokenella regensburgei TaxID=158877 RepID=UPI003F13CD0F